MGHNYGCHFSGVDCEVGCECDANTDDGMGACQYFKGVVGEIDDVYQTRFTGSEHFLHFCFNMRTAGRAVKCTLCGRPAAKMGELTARVPRSIYHNELKNGFACKDCAASLMESTLSHLAYITNELRLFGKEAQDANV